MRKRSPIIVLPLFLEIFNINPLFLLIVSSAAQGSSNIYLDNAANGRNFLENVAEHIIVLFGRAHHCYTLLCFSEGHTILTLLHIVTIVRRPRCNQHLLEGV